MNTPPCVDIQFYVVVGKYDDICHLGCNECLDFIAIRQCLNVLEEEYFRRDGLSVEDNFLLKYDSYAMEIFNLFYVIKFQLLNARVARSD